MLTWTGVYWWDPWHTIYSSTMDPMVNESNEKYAFERRKWWSSRKNIVRNESSTKKSRVSDIPLLNLNSSKVKSPFGFKSPYCLLQSQFTTSLNHIQSSISPGSNPFFSVSYVRLCRHFRYNSPSPNIKHRRTGLIWDFARWPLPRPFRPWPWPIPTFRRWKC